MAEVPSKPGQSVTDEGGTTGTGNAKGLLQSLSRGVRDLLILSEKLGALGKEDERSRKSIEDLQAVVQRMVGALPEMERRTAERFAELDKRLGEVDKRVQLQIELAVRNALDKRDGQAGPARGPRRLRQAERQDPIE